VATKLEILPELADVALVNRKQILSILSISASTWHAGIRAGIFLPPIKNGKTDKNPGGSSARWRASYIRELAQRYARGQIPVIEPAAKRPRGKRKIPTPPELRTGIVSVKHSGDLNPDIEQLVDEVLAERSRPPRARPRRHTANPNVLTAAAERKSGR
jgi:hypothetical protein